MEIETAASISSKLGLKHEIIRAPIERKFGLSRSEHAVPKQKAEFWPYRNQFIGTVAAMHLYGTKTREIWFGTVKSDIRFSDGSKGFFTRMNSLIAHQEGGILFVNAVHEVCDAIWLPNKATLECRDSDLPAQHLVNDLSNRQSFHLSPL